MKKWILLLSLLVMATMLSACKCAHETQHRANVSEANCTENGYTGDMVCDECEEVVTPGAVIPALGHNESEPLYTKEATCLEPGYSGDIHCLTCLTLITKGEETPVGDHVPGDDYSYEATCTYEGHISQLNCIYCDTILREAAEVPAFGHYIPDAKDAYPATCTSFGKRGEGTCVNCNSYVENCTIDLLPHNYAGLQCADCGYYKPGLYSDDMSEQIYTWEELLEMKVFNDGDFKKVIGSINGLEGVLVIEEGCNIDLSGYSSFNDGYEFTLSGIHLPYSVVELYDGAFRGVTMKTLKICGNVTRLPDYFLAGAQIEELILPETLTVVGYSAFYGYAAEELILPDSVEVIEQRGIYSCANLKSFTIPKNLREIGDDALRDCTALEEIVLDSPIEKVGDCVFGDCTELTSVTFGENFHIIGAGMFQNCTALTEIELPEGMTHILNNAFYGTNIAELIMPSTIVYMEDFVQMPELEYVDMSECEQLTEWKGNLIYCQNLTEVILPPNLVTMGNIFQDNPMLRRVVLPDTLETLYIKNKVARTGLEEIVWPVSLKDGSVLSGAENLVSILYRGTEEQWNETVSKDMFPNAQVIFNYTGY